MKWGVPEGKWSHCLTPRPRKLERLSDTFESGAFSNAAGVAFIIR